MKTLWWHTKATQSPDLTVSLQVSLDLLKQKAIPWTPENYSMFAGSVFTES